MRDFVAFLLSLVLCSAAANAATVKFTRTNYTVGGHPVSVGTGDFNSDGIPDVITANAVSLTVLLGNGDGTLRKTKATAAQTESFTLGDFNRDGKLDVVYVSDRSSDVVALLGNGDGTFQSGVSYAVTGTPGIVTSADFNGDSKLDLLVVIPVANLVNVLLGNGDGSFQAPSDVPADVPFSLATGYFNHDGKLDFAAGSGGVDTVIDLVLGNGDGTFQPAVPITTSDFDPRLVGAVDVNNDGNLDLVFVGFSNSPTGVLLGNGDGTFQPEIDSGGPGQFGLASYAIADFDGDGKLDCAASASLTAFVDLYSGFGNGHFHISQKLVPSTTLGAFTVAAADLNADSRPDLIVANQAGTLTVYLNQGP